MTATVPRREISAKQMVTEMSTLAARASAAMNELCDDLPPLSWTFVDGGREIIGRADSKEDAQRWREALSLKEVGKHGDGSRTYRRHLDNCVIGVWFVSNIRLWNGR